MTYGIGLIAIMANYSSDEVSGDRTGGVHSHLAWEITEAAANFGAKPTVAPKFVLARVKECMLY